MTPPWLILNFVGVVLETMFYGIYCVIFSLYLGIQFKRANPWKGVLFYALSLNFILCTAYFVVNVVQLRFNIGLEIKELVKGPSLWALGAWLTFTDDALYTAIDFISQLILFYRCWILWRKPLVLVVPALFSLAFLVTSVTTLGFLIASPGYGTEDGPYTPDWFASAVVAFFALSLVTNALLTGLIIYKIVSVYRDIRGFDKTPAVSAYGNGTRDLYPLVSILVESGIITFAAQLVQSIMYKVALSEFSVVSGLIVMLYGISTTIVLVRVGSGISYDRHTSRTANSGHPINFAPYESKDNRTTTSVSGGDLKDPSFEMKLRRNV